eukprot:gene1158-4376_t
MADTEDDDQALLLESEAIDEADLIGSINLATASEQDTLDEHVWETVKRDLSQIMTKFFHVLVPRKGGKELLRNWDLWGPMALTITLALLLRENAQDGQKTQVFTGVFFIIGAGSVIVTVNNQLLSGTMSIFQGMCVLGYCMLPLVCSCILLRVVAYLTSHIIVRFLVVIVGLVWSIFASLGFVAQSSPVSRKALVVYPIVLYYVFIAWLVLNDVRASHTVAPSPTIAPQPNR